MTERTHISVKAEYLIGLLHLERLVRAHEDHRIEIDELYSGLHHLDAMLAADLIADFKSGEMDRAIRDAEELTEMASENERFREAMREAILISSDSALRGSDYTLAAFNAIGERLASAMGETE